MAKNKPKKTTPQTFESNNTRAVIIAWLNDSTSSPQDYLTKEGMAYLNGFLQSNDTMGLIKVERYNDLLEKYESLIKKYEDEKNKTKRRSMWQRFKDWMDNSHKMIEEPDWYDIEDDYM